MSDQETQTHTTERRENGRNLLLLLGGATLLGLALGLLLIGGGLMLRNDDGQGSGSVFEQVPQPGDIQSETAELPLSSRLLEPGDQAPDFTLNDLEGNSVTLSQLRGKPVILNFWATWCAPCRIEMPALQAAHEKYQDEGLVILALDYEEQPDVVREFFYEELELTFTPLLDQDGTVAERYNVFNFPSSFFLNAEGTITAVHRGMMTESQIDGYLADTLSGQG